MKKLFIMLITLLLWGVQAGFSQPYGKTITIKQDTVVSILDLYPNPMGLGEVGLDTRIVNTRNGNFSVRITIPSEVVDCDPGTNCRKISASQLMIEKPGYFSLGYSYGGQRMLVFGHLNYECELLLDGTPAPDSIFIQSDEDLERELGVPTGIFEDCWWFWDELSEDNILPFSSNKVKVKDLLGDNTERLIILQTNDGSKNVDENWEPLGYSRDSIVIIDERVSTAISSLSKEEMRITPTTQGFIIHGAKSGEKLSLFNLSGQLVWSEKAKGTAQQVNLVGIPTGIYLLRINNRSFKLSL